MPVIAKNSKPRSRSCNIRPDKHRSISEMSGNSISPASKYLEPIEIVKAHINSLSKMIPQ
jgi:hypothetical protein